MRPALLALVVLVVACGDSRGEVREGRACEHLGERMCGEGDAVLECRHDASATSVAPRIARDGPGLVPRYELLRTCGTDERCQDGACVHDPDDDDDDF